MAADSPEVPEDFTQASTPDNNDSDRDTALVQRPELGQSLRGMLLAKKPDRGDWDNMVIEVKLTEPYATEGGELGKGELVHMWTTNGIEAALEGDDDSEEVPRGAEVIIVCDDTWTTDDGEDRRTYSVYHK